VPAGAKSGMVAIAPSAETVALLKRHEDFIARLARIETISEAETPPKGAVQVIHDGAVFALPLADVIDVAAEKTRLEKETAKAKTEIEAVDKKLGNEKFVSRAPTEVVEEQKSRRAGYADELDKLTAALSRLEEL